MAGLSSNNNTAEVNQKNFDYFRAFSRNIGIISAVEQARLARVCAVIPGCGGVGGLHAITLARLGVGRFVLADFDQFEIENFNRQFGARMSTLGLDKAQVIRADILQINPQAEIKILSTGVNPETIDEFLKDADIVVDSLDFFAFSARDLLFTTARNRGIPVVTGAPLGMSCALLVFTDKGMSYRDYFDVSSEDTHEDKALKFALGLAPKGVHLSYMNKDSIDLKSGRGPSCAVAIDLCAGMVATEVLRIVLNRPGIRPAPHFVQFDTYRQIFRKGYLYCGNRHPIQRLKIWLVKKFMLNRTPKVS